MKLLAILLLLALVVPVQAQTTVYLPVIMKGNSMSESWQFITPVYSKNLVHNPSAEGTTGYTALGGATVNRSTDQSFFGLYSYYLATFANGDGLQLTTDTLAAGVHFVTLHVRGVWPENWRVLVRTQYRTPVLLETFDENWRLYGLRIPAEDADGATSLSILQVGEGGSSMYLDAFQVEALSYPTTYIDGTRPDCRWTGAEHSSSSWRSAASRAGGKVNDFYADYGFVVEKSEGTGTPPAKLTLNSYALLSGGQVTATRHESRRFTLVGTLIADSEQELYERREALAQALDPVAYDGQEVIIRFAAEETQKEIGCHYEGGLEADLPVYTDGYRREIRSGEWEEPSVYLEGIGLQFLCGDPYWKEIGESSVELDPNDHATFRIVGARLTDTGGQWDNLGPPAAGPPAVYNSVKAIAEDADFVYCAGDFTDFNNDPTGFSDYIVRYEKQTGEWSALGRGTDGAVSSLVLSSDGRLFVGGSFLNAGVVGAPYIAVWDPATEAWSPVGGGMDGSVAALAISRGGLLYAAGFFTTAGGVAANYVASYNLDTGAWSALGAGVNNNARSVTVMPDDTLIVGGNFTQAGAPAVTVNYIAAWDGSNWSALADGMDARVYGVAARSDGKLFAAGDFTGYAAEWNGTSWNVLGGGLNNTALFIGITPDNLILVGGDFDQAGDLTLTDRLAAWNNSAWTHFDIDLPAAATAYAFHSSPNDPVVSSRYNLWIGFDTSGVAYYSGVSTATNDGTRAAHPILTFERTGGSSPATVEWIRNETTGKTIWLDYSLSDGEKLTLDLRPTQLAITSSRFGSVLYAALAASDLSQFVLEPGDNVLSCFVSYDFGLYPSEIVAAVIWKDTYLSLD